MAVMDLVKSAVIFDQVKHHYYFEGKRLSGITRLISDALGIGYGSDMTSGFKFYISRAAEYGTSVHRAIEMYECSGVKITVFPKDAKYQDDANDTTWDVSRELESYIKHKEGFTSVAYEYTVSNAGFVDNPRYVTNIDNVWLKNDTDEVWLIDTKTSNISTSKKREELKAYLSWQLSVEAYLFEIQNPGIKVKGLACNWLRGDKAEFWEIPRQPNSCIETLLSCEWSFNEDGEIVIDPSNALPLRSLPSVMPKQDIVSAEVIRTISEMLRLKEKADKTISTLREELRKAMNEHGVKSWDTDFFTATVVDETATTTFDSKSFKVDHPDLHEQYSKQSTRKGSITIKLKTNS